MWERERRQEAPREEPKTFAYLRQAAGKIEHFKGADSRFELLDILSDATSLKHVGPALVDQFGVDLSRQVATCVGVLAQMDLAEDGNNRIAKSAARWARQANERIKDDGWEDPQPVLNQEPQWGGYGSSRLWDYDWK